MDLVVHKKNRLLFLLITATFMVGFFLRTYKLDLYPLQINQDELSNIYDGYCIAETGADRWGDKAPIILKGFGDFDNRPPLYSYLTAVSVKMFGYSVKTGRLPSAIIGCISLVLLFLVAQKIGGKLYGFICLLLAALSPWHLLFSRIAHEGAALPPFFIILTLYLWQVCQEKEYKIKHLIFLGLAVGLATNAYQATKIIFLIISLILGVVIFLQTHKDFKKLLIFFTATGIGALPQFLALILYPDRFFSRANDQLIQFSFSKRFVKEVANNFLSNFNPEHLFLNFGEFNNLSIGRLLAVEIGFFYVGLFLFYIIFIKNKKLEVRLTYIFLVVSLIPAAITQDNPHALRTSVAILIFPLFTGASFLFFIEKLQSYKFGLALSFILIGALVVNSAYYIKLYSKSMPLRAKGQQYGQVAMYQKMKQYDKYFENVHIQLFGAFQYLFVASYCDIKPKEYQLSEKVYTKAGWYDFKKLGKYSFMTADEIHKANSTPKNGKNLIVLLEKTDKYTFLDSLNYMGERMYYYKN